MKYLRRLVWFIASRLFVLLLVLGLSVVTFYYAMNLSNIQIVLKDGLALRAKITMGLEDTGELPKYFQSSFPERDQVLLTVAAGQSPYADYNINGIDHRVEPGFTWIWPWDDTVRLELTESIPHIDGRVKSAKAEAITSSGGSVYPPAWQSARYKAVLVKENGQWLIKSLTLVEYLSE